MPYYAYFAPLSLELPAEIRAVLTAGVARLRGAVGGRDARLSGDSPA